MKPLHRAVPSRLRRAGEVVALVPSILAALILGHLIYATLLPSYAWRHRHGGFSWAEAFGWNLRGPRPPIP